MLPQRQVEGEGLTYFMPLRFFAKNLLFADCRLLIAVCFHLRFTIDYSLFTAFSCLPFTVCCSLLFTIYDSRFTALRHAWVLA